MTDAEPVANLACPFCGSERLGMYTCPLSVECQGCGVIVRFPWAQDGRQLFGSWNKRDVRALTDLRAEKAALVAAARAYVRAESDLETERHAQRFGERWECLCERHETTRAALVAKLGEG